MELQWAKPFQMDLQLVQCGWQKCDSLHFYGPHMRDFFLIHFIVEGKGIFTVNQCTYHLNANNGFVIWPGVTTYYQADYDEPWAYYWFAYRGRDAEAITRRCGMSPDNPIFLCSNHEKVDEIILKMCDDVVNNRLGGISALGKMLLLLDIIARESSILPAKEPLPLSSAREYFHKAVRYIDEHYADVTVNDTAEYVHLSRSQLYRVFERVMGSSPQQIIINKRLEQVCHLLLNSNLTVEKIALQCGFCDPSHLISLFQKRFQMTPRQYRGKAHAYSGSEKVI